MPTKAVLGTVKSPTIVDVMKEYSYLVSHLPTVAILSNATGQFMTIHSALKYTDRW